MGDVSNKTLAFLLVAAIAVSFGGFVMLNSGFSQITAFATGNTTNTGKVNISITQVLSVNMTDVLIDFGSSDNITAAASINISCDSSTGTQLLDGSAGTSFNGPGCTSGDIFSMWNDGNVDVNISINLTGNASDFVCQDTGLNGYTNCVSKSELKFKLSGDACTSGITTYTTFPTGIENTSWCTGLFASTPSNRNWANVSAFVSVPVNGSSTNNAESTVNVIFTAVKS